MPNVTEVQPKGDRGAILVLDDGQRVWTPDKEKADPLVGKPIPSDWTMKQGDFGPQALPPRDRKGSAPAAFRNTKEGQAVEQERMDRRTALMQAVTLVAAAKDVPADPGLVGQPIISRIANDFYTWLRATAGAQGSSSGPAAPAPGAPPSSVPGGTTSQAQSGKRNGGQPAETEQGQQGQGEQGEGLSTPAGCAHENTSPLKPDGGALPAGFLRCVECGVVHKEAS